MNVFQTCVLDWYEHNKRDLPWRKTTDPYKILVSEVMLQQTQVLRVIPKYLAFLDAFPGFLDLAQASPSAVLVLWSGLGYNSRAIRLQETARIIHERDGVWPKTVDGLMALPGIGPYTSRAVLSFAYNHNYAVVDTNVRRVFSRVFFQGKGTVKEIDARVRNELPNGHARLWNNALMDFGSMMCTAKSPQCNLCPICEMCTAYARGTQHTYLKTAPCQKTFKGSTRYYRGQILKLLKTAPNHTVSIAALKKRFPSCDMIALVNSLQCDKLIRITKRSVRLP